jgi:hypothetical protein
MELARNAVDQDAVADRDFAGWIVADGEVRFYESSGPDAELLAETDNNL